MSVPRHRRLRIRLSVQSDDTAEASQGRAQHRRSFGPLDHIVSLAVGGRRGRAPRFEDRPPSSDRPPRRHSRVPGEARPRDQPGRAGGPPGEAGHERGTPGQGIPRRPDPRVEPGRRMGPVRHGHPRHPDRRPGGGAAMSAWETGLRRAGLSTPERLVAGQLVAFVTRPTGAFVDPAVPASRCCLPVSVVLAARRLIRTNADGRVALPGPIPRPSRWTTTLLAAVDGPVPPFRGPEWQALPDNSWAKMASAAVAAECWWSQGQTLATDLAAELDAQREHENDARWTPHVVARVHRSATRPCYAELCDRRGERERAERARWHQQRLRDLPDGGAT